MSPKETKWREKDRKKKGGCWKLLDIGELDIMTVLALSESSTGLSTVPSLVKGSNT